MRLAGVLAIPPVVLLMVLSLLFTYEELFCLQSARKRSLQLIQSRSAWLRISDITVEGITDERMALVHLLWLQRVGRVVVEDIEPYAGAVLVHLEFGGAEWEEDNGTVANS